MRRWASLLLLAIWFAASPAMGLKPDTEYRALPSHYGLMYDDVTFVTRDRISIHGWFFPAQDTAGISHQFVGRLIPVPAQMRSPARDYRPPDSKRHPTIIVCNGDAANMTYLILYAYHFCTHGFNVLTFDWRGFGSSGRWSIDVDQLVYTEFLLDYEAAIEFARVRPETDSLRIGLFGFSTGAYLSFAMAIQRDDIGALVCRGLMTTFDDVVPILTRAAPDRPLYVPEDYPDELQPLTAAERMTSPILLVVGENDSRTPPSMSRRIFERLPGPKDLWVVPGAGHGGETAPEYVHYPAFFDRARSFFEAHLSKSGD